MQSVFRHLLAQVLQVGVFHYEGVNVGVLDSIAKAIAERIEKAPSLPAGSVTMSEQEMRNNAVQSYGQSNPLPRNEITPNVPFSPGRPIIPGAINPFIDGGRPEPRRYEFQVAQNINITETRLTPFKTLRGAADQIDILRRCIEVLKSKLTGLDWDIVLAEDAAEKLISEIGGSRSRAMVEARKRYTEEINKAKQFWEQPDKANGLIFIDWLNIALEEILVLDAWAVWPQMSVNGDLYGLQILDGGTIKPLIDERGMRPMTPNPAYQQILYGFPRSEFAAPDENEDADGTFTADQLAYMVKNRRTTSVYGYSPVERSLMVADIYLRRQQWLRAEYTDGVTPELLMKTDANFGNNPDLLRRFEDVFNNDLSGQTEQRKRVRLLPAGMEPIQFDGYGEKFKDTLDEYLVNSICGHFGVQPSEIGFTPKHGLGGAGFQSGQADSSEVIGVVPMAQWLGRMLSNLSYVFLGMPRELEFKFMDSVREDMEKTAMARDIELKNGSITMNEMRSEAGRPLIDAPEADMPIVVAGANAYLFTDEGVKLFGQEEGDADQDPALTGVDPNNSNAISNNPNETPANEEDEQLPAATDNASDKAFKELKSFIRFLRKSPDRTFNFEHVPATYANVLNKFIAVKDYDGARWYAERYLP